ncbi:hypothetical protein A3D88_01515 [Candidatus Peribacteria bacterium RIFCSPHIGHO2_02_FULL_52_16]|nr:MAG: hypothetical protein A2706_03755 [Candidatus Peribacteria bacterium RIFCSPHIGHO2_01_FULL_51_35]OGJ60998.1 MAG: hypothetical protein A3D88_01515 [Candidatus Peribacteria bacterium RIFCSPHIGHO2_02_FULL_52_16]
MKKRILRWLGNIIALVVALFLILAVLEVAVRIFIPQSSILTVRDRYIGRTLKPNMDVHLQGSDWASHLWTNAYGWNGNTFPVEKPGHIKRILHIGDSLVEAIHVDTDKNFVSQLEQHMPGTQQLNLSVAGRGTFLELLTYRHYGRSYNPDVTVLWFYTGNDSRDNYVTRDFIKGISMEESVIEEPQLGILKTFLLQKLRLPRLIFEKGKDNPLFLWLLVRTGLLSTEPEELNRDIPLGLATTIVDTPERALAMEVNEKLLVAMKKEVDKGMLVLGIIPSLLEMDLRTTPELIEKYPVLQGKKIDLDFSQKRIAELAEQHGILVFNATPVLRQALLDGKKPYLEGDGHLSQEGHDIIAREFKAWLIAHNLP